MNKPSLAKQVLEILLEIGKGQVQAFFPEKYAKKYNYTSLYPRIYKRSSFHSTLRNLEKRKLIKRDGDIFYLTPAGQKEAFLASIESGLRSYAPPKKEKWDGKWRVIFFDVPEKKRRSRNYLRTVIKEVGFKEFQKSVWIYPYKIPLFLKELLWDENIKPYTRFITTTDIEYDKDIKKLFKL